jgi:hypothetical protein
MSVPSHLPCCILSKDSLHISCMTHHLRCVVLCHITNILRHVTISAGGCYKKDMHVSYLCLATLTGNLHNRTVIGQTCHYESSSVGQNISFSKAWDTISGYSLLHSWQCPNLLSIVTMFTHSLSTRLSVTRFITCNIHKFVVLHPIVGYKLICVLMFWCVMFVITITIKHFFASCV